MYRIVVITVLTFVGAHGFSIVKYADPILENFEDEAKEYYNSLSEQLYGGNALLNGSNRKEETYEENPDVHLGTLELLRKYGYPAEEHEVITQDGFILNLHRIPHGRHNKNDSTSRPVVLLHHGLLCSSRDWLMNTVDKALGYQLADEGYDVWVRVWTYYSHILLQQPAEMANVRGNIYSRRHMTLIPDEPAFWDFSFHEVAVYDLPSEIDYILATTEQSEIRYIGHSMGTVVFWIAMSVHPEYNSKIHSMLALGPVAFLNGTVSPIRHFMEIAPELEFAERLFGEREFLPNSGILRSMETFICEEKYLERMICESVMFLLCGYDRPQMNMSMIPVITSHNPAGTSTHTVIHFLQLMKSGKFRQFDFGKHRNIKKYGQEQPPDYDLSKVLVKVALFYGKNDWLAVPGDVLELASKLPNNVLTYEVKLDEFNHLDFLYAIDINVLLNNDLLHYLKKL